MEVPWNWEQFELVVELMRNRVDEMLKGIFIDILKDEVHAELKRYHSGSLSELMDRESIITGREKQYSETRRHREEDKRGWKEKGGLMSRPRNWIEGTKWRTNRGNNIQAERTTIEAKTEDLPGSNFKSHWQRTEAIPC
ncbi:unnamed protein product [Cuscuta epithymum]|uniref:Uncharacterized protein n=1 Tax=Cuscuta epithymum TaxID=186058 RepID=A0AAV0GB43_9ASTE|nr:unnamed protein product [Cuscuta epithymum]